MTELELMQIDVHADTVQALPKSLHLVLHLGMSGHSRCNPNDLPSYLVLHEQPYYSDYSRKDHATFDPHLVLHHIPGHSRHRCWRVARRRRLCRLLLRGPERHPPTTISIVVAIRGTPCSIRLRVPARWQSTAPHARWRSPTRASGRNHRRHFEQARFFLTATTTIAEHHPAQRWVIYDEHPRVNSHKRCSPEHDRRRHHHVRCVASLVELLACDAMCSALGQLACDASRASPRVSSIDGRGGSCGFLELGTSLPHKRPP